MYLLIDNSSDDLVLSYSLNGQAIKQLIVKNGEVLPTINRLFKKNKLTINDLSGIAVVVGHGRFTATRIAVTVANTLAFANHIPAIAVNNSNDDWLQLVKQATVGHYVSAKYSGEAHLGSPKSPL